MERCEGRCNYAAVSNNDDSFKSGFVIPAKAGIQGNEGKLGFPPSRE